MGESIKDVLLYASVGQNNYKMVRQTIIKVNRATAKVISAVATVLILVMFLSTFVVEGIVQNRMVYAIGLIVTGIQFVCSITLMNHYEQIVKPLVYSCYSAFYIYGIMIGTITDPAQKTATFMVMLVLLPTLFVDRPLHTIMVSVIYTTIFIILCFHVKTGQILSNDIIDAVIFGLLGMASGTISNCARVRDYVTQKQLKSAYLKLKDVSRIDTLTGLQNRNAYESDLLKVSKYCEESLACVYIDANGLKTLNDNKGHDEGDKMLKTVAEGIKEYFGDDLSYRIGGDEFVTFVVDPKHFEIKNRADKLLAYIRQDGYYASVGWKIHDLEELSMKDLVKDAENYMYQKKVEFYKQAGFDRRSKTEKQES